MTRLISLAFVVLLLTACSTSHPPAGAEPEGVELYWYYWSADPPYGHEPILRIEKVQRASGCPSNPSGSPVRPPEPGSELSELIVALRTEAAELGADAVIETRLNCRDGRLRNDVRGRYPRWVVTGLAVHWPDPSSRRR